MNCENCKDEYNLLNKKPVLLPCSHYICFKCNYKLKKQDIYSCPFCNKVFNKQIKPEIDTQKMELIKMNHSNSLLETSNLQILSENLYETGQKFKYKFKFATLGSLNTGKTCILNQYFNKTFCQTSATICVEFFSKAYAFKNMNIFLTAIDTAGSEQYKSITQKYISDKHVLLFVYDLTDRKSFQDITEWVKWSDDHSKDNVIKILVGNKSDLEDQRQVQKEEGVELATLLKMNYFEVSAKTGKNLSRLFEFCMKKCYFTFKNEQQAQGDDFQLKIVPQQKKNCFGFFKEFFFGSKKNQKNKQRKAMLVEPLKAHNLVGTMSANNSPQINAPRMLVKNVPEPRDSTTSYPQETLNTQPQLPPLTVLPPSFVNAELDGPKPQKLTQQPRSLSRRRRKGRKLNVLPYMNMGPGYMDFGSNGFSPMSFAMSHPQMSSMSPFIPRSGPPAPVRIQLRDSVAERFKSNFLTTSERAVKDKDIEALKSQVEHEMVKFTEELGAAQEDLGIYLQRIQNKLEDYETHRRTVKNEIAVMQKEITDQKNKQNGDQQTEQKNETNQINMRLRKI